MIRKIVLTGGTGVVGSAVIRYCIKKEIEVCVIVRPQSERAKNIVTHPLVHQIECDLSNLDSLKNVKLCKQSDAFLHLGWSGTTGEARNKEEVQQKNVHYSEQACKTAVELGCKVFLFAGSQAEFGRVEGLLNGDVPTKPENEYGKAKLEAGYKTKELCKHNGMKHIYIRILSVYGPGDGHQSMIMSTINALKEGNSPKFTSGEQMWDYLYSDDAARALMHACERGREDCIYCLGSGSARPLKEYIEIIGQIINPEVNLQIGALPYSDKQVMYLCADISDLKKDFEFEPLITFEEGIRRIVSEDKKKKETESNVRHEKDKHFDTLLQ